MVVYEIIPNKCLIFCYFFFFLLFSLSCAIVKIAFELVALIGLLKYWVLQTDWVTPPGNTIFSSLTVL